VTGLCALTFVVALPAAEAQARLRESATPGLDALAAHHAQIARRSRQVLRFFDRHDWLLRDPRFRDEARDRVAAHAAAVRRAERRLLAIRGEIRQASSREQRRRAAARAPRTPQEAICRVFGRYCAQALTVARCESGYRTTAQNGQYLGIFQMGSSERRLFGHGPSALAQARAAHRYFVHSGRDWSPWSCKPW
jgi:hypothetical protein